MAALDAGERAHVTANKLAKLLRGYPWYHRTSVLKKTYSDSWCVTIQVWGTCDTRPDCLPAELEGFAVAFSKVTKESPCPFGGVR